MIRSLTRSATALLLLVTALIAIGEFRSIQMLSGPVVITIAVTTASIDSPIAPATTQPLFPGQPGI